MIDNDLLLFIEPQNEPSNMPLVDRITKKMIYMYRRGCKGVEVNKSYNNKDTYMLAGMPAIVEMPWNPKYNFSLFNYYMGYHQCSCGSKSECCNFLLQTGDIVNSLCIHYLAFHRDEVTQEQLNKIEGWRLIKEDDICYPTDDELSWPPREKIERKPMTRQGFLNSLKND